MITPDLSGAVWRKSSRSSGNNGNCVELACVSTRRAVRDSKSPAGGVLTFDQDELAAFLAQVKVGRFDG